MLTDNVYLFVDGLRQIFQAVCNDGTCKGCRRKQSDPVWGIIWAFTWTEEILIRSNLPKLEPLLTSVLSYILYVLTYLLTYFLIYIYTYLITPCSRVLLEKLIVSQLVKKFPAFYWTRRFITAFTGPRHLSLSWASSIQSIPPQPTSWRPILILSSHLRLGLPSGLFPSGFLTKAPYAPLLSLYVLQAPPV